jgi:hypothetical protein
LSSSSSGHALGVRGRLPLRAHLEEVDEEVVGQRCCALGEHAVRGLAGIVAENAQTATENSHPWCRQNQQLCSVH